MSLLLSRLSFGTLKEKLSGRPKHLFISAYRKKNAANIMIHNDITIILLFFLQNRRTLLNI